MRAVRGPACLNHTAALLKCKTHKICSANSLAALHADVSSARLQGPATWMKDAGQAKCQVPASLIRVVVATADRNAAIGCKTH